MMMKTEDWLMQSTTTGGEGQLRRGPQQALSRPDLDPDLGPREFDRHPALQRQRLVRPGVCSQVGPGLLR